MYCVLLSAVIYRNAFNEMLTCEEEIKAAPAALGVVTWAGGAALLMWPILTTGRVRASAASLDVSRTFAVGLAKVAAARRAWTTKVEMNMANSFGSGVDSNGDLSLRSSLRCLGPFYMSRPRVKSTAFKLKWCFVLPMLAEIVSDERGHGSEAAPKHGELLCLTISLY